MRPPHRRLAFLETDADIICVALDFFFVICYTLLTGPRSIQAVVCHDHLEGSAPGSLRHDRTWFLPVPAFLGSLSPPEMLGESEWKMSAIRPEASVPPHAARWALGFTSNAYGVEFTARAAAEVTALGCFDDPRFDPIQPSNTVYRRVKPDADRHRYLCSKPCRRAARRVRPDPA